MQNPIIGLNLANIARSIHHAILSRTMVGADDIDEPNAWPPAFFFLLSHRKIYSTSSVPSYGKPQIDLKAKSRQESLSW